jgi:hypothetical protein
MSRTNIAALEFGERGGVGCTREGGEGSAMDESACALNGDSVDWRVPAVLPIRIDLDRASPVIAQYHRLVVDQRPVHRQIANRLGDRMDGGEVKSI